MQAVATCDGLVSLRVRGHGSLTDACIAAVSALQKLELLQFACISCKLDVSNGGLASPAAAMPRLRYLSVSEYDDCSRVRAQATRCRIWWLCTTANAFAQLPASVLRAQENATNNLILQMPIYSSLTEASVSMQLVKRIGQHGGVNFQLPGLPGRVFSHAPSCQLHLLDGADDTSFCSLSTQDEWWLSRCLG